jgi:hypothetical protein
MVRRSFLPSVSLAPYASPRGSGRAGDWLTPTNSAKNPRDSRSEICSLTVVGGRDLAIAYNDADTLPPKILEPRRRQLGIAHRVLNVPVTQISL